MVRCAISSWLLHLEMVLPNSTGSSDNQDKNNFDPFSLMTCDKIISNNGTYHCLNDYTHVSAWRGWSCHKIWHQYYHAAHAESDHRSNNWTRLAQISWSKQPSKKRQIRFLINDLACFRRFHPQVMILPSQIMMLVEGKSLQILTLLVDLVIPI